jgi:hypothetical protein
MILQAIFLDRMESLIYDAYRLGNEMNCLSTEKRVRVIAPPVEGATINAIVRMTGVAKHTFLKLLENTGCACAAYHHLQVTPAMDSGLTDHVGSMEELLGLAKRKEKMAAQVPKETAPFGAVVSDVHHIGAVRLV